MAEVSTAGEVNVEDQFVGNIFGLKFELDATEDQAQEKALKSASMKEVSLEINRRVDQIITEEKSQLSIDDKGQICWGEFPIARIEAGDVTLNPYSSIIENDYLSSADEARLNDFVKKWLKAEIETHLSSLLKLNDPDNVTGLARGVAFQLVENYGILVRDEVNDDIKALDQESRKQLRRFGVRFGAYHVFIPQLLKPAPTRLLMLLAALKIAKDNGSALTVPPHPGQGLTSVALDPTMSHNYYQTAGFRKCVNRAVRIDMLERLADLIRDVLYWKPQAATKAVNVVKPEAMVDTKPDETMTEDVKAETPNTDNAEVVKAVVEVITPERPLGAHISGGFTVTPNMMSLVGCSGDDFSNILTTIGYRMTKIEIEKIDAVAANDSSDVDVDTDADKAEIQTHDEVWFPAKKRQVAHNHRAGKKKFDAKQQNKRKFTKFDKNKNQSKTVKKSKPTIAPKNSPFAALMALKNKM
ncbi:MAG: hypothetical protein HRU28_15010 [Rhizobiales bacterium]|nr:hypothetical protein [Hyphomicrobiales bacterium]